MDKEKYELADNTYKTGKHSNQLQRCIVYLNAIESGYATVDVIREAEQFSLDTYNDLSKDDLMVVLANTCRETRNIAPIDNLHRNLKALENMLIELIVEETKDVNENMKKLNDNKN